MSHVSIIGTGNMAQAIGGLVSKGGNTVDLLPRRRPSNRRLTGDIVVVAVPYPSVADRRATSNTVVTSWRFRRCVPRRRRAARRRCPAMPSRGRW